MSETRWFRSGEMEFEVEVGTPEHASLIALGAEPLVAPVAAVSDDTVSGDVEDLDVLSREALNAVAEEAGVEDPGKLPNKAAVIDAINEVRDAEELGADE